MTRRQANDLFLARIRDLVHKSDKTWMQIRPELDKDLTEFVAQIERELLPVA